MSYEVKRAAVIGAGVMGAAIAAHLANVGVPALLLDVPAEGEGREARDRLARQGLERALKASPALFYDKADARLITTGNVEDDLERLRSCDLVVEAIVERLEAKRALFARVAEVRAPHAIVSSNTSGISVNAMAAGLPDDFQRHFLVTHFFNPVRYMRLLEIVPGRATNPDVVEAAQRFGTERLGKGVVLCKDTPNFIANRLGVYGFMIALRRALDEGYRFDEVDTIMGEPMGRPRSAIFRTCDIAGLDVLLHVAQNVYDNAPDHETMEYRPREKWRFDSIGEVRDNPDPAARIRGIVSADDRAARFARPLMRDLLAYSARRVPEIADSPQEVDDAMRWGFNWALGPFQTWDALGVANVAEALQADGREVPPLVRDVLERGEGRFYSAHGGRRAVFVPAAASYVPLPPR